MNLRHGRLLNCFVTYGRSEGCTEEPRTLASNGVAARQESRAKRMEGNPGELAVVTG